MAIGLNKTRKSEARFLIAVSRWTTEVVIDFITLAGPGSKRNKQVDIAEPGALATGSKREVNPVANASGSDRIKIGQYRKKNAYGKSPWAFSSDWDSGGNLIRLRLD